MYKIVDEITAEYTIEEAIEQCIKRVTIFNSPLTRAYDTQGREKVRAYKEENGETKIILTDDKAVEYKINVDISDDLGDITAQVQNLTNDGVQF